LRIYGNVRIENIARRLDLTERHLERLFREQVGVAP
jgi:transcriptional regulator GlxA family with amidase domain